MRGYLPIGKLASFPDRIDHNTLVQLYSVFKGGGLDQGLDQGFKATFWVGRIIIDL